MTPSVSFALIASGVFLMSGMLTGVWKYLCMTRSANTDGKAEAPMYVDIAHRTSLMYSFAALVVAKFAELSPWSANVTLVSTVAPIVFFGLSIAIYIVHGFLNDTDNQLKKPHKLGKRTISGLFVHGFMWALIVAEIGGFAVLLCGAIKTLTA
ncbi:MAG: hypothetical protein ACI91G_000707 [Gammaproteobacteria bacterium]|jgi:hypothetical protein